MHRIVRTALATMGAAVIVGGGSLGVAYATTPSTDPAQASASNDSDQVATLNKQADDLLSKIEALQKQLAATTAPTSSPSDLTKQEPAQSSDEGQSPSQTTATTAHAPASVAAAPTAQRTDERDSENGDDTDD